jgi:predicted component of type VI protein secretion system
MRQSHPISFKILALAPFCHPAEKRKSKGPVAVNATTLDSVMAEFKPDFYLPLPQSLCSDGGLKITCSRLEDFHPDALAQNIPFLKHLMEATNFLKKARASNLPQGEIEALLHQWPDLPELTQSYGVEKSDAASKRVDRILAAVDLPRGISPSAKKNTEPIGTAETVIQEILAAIFQHQPFKTAQAAWHGLHLMLQKKTGHEQAIVTIAPVSHDTLQDTLDRLLPQMIENTPSLIVVDLPFKSSVRDLELLKAIAAFAETLLAPALVWITPAFFHLKTWNNLAKCMYLPHFLETAAYAKWRSLKKTAMAKWLTVTCNCFTMRHAYGPRNKPSSVYFEEPGLPWVAPVWAIADMLVQSHLKTGRPTRFTDWQRIRVESLALRTGTTGRCPTETIFSADRANQLIRSNITPLMGIAGQDFVCTPAETTLGGPSLSDQIYLSIIIDYIIKLKESAQIDTKEEMLEKDIRKALIRFPGARLNPDTKALFVSAGPVDSAGQTPLTIRILPEGTRPPLRNPIELTFSW